MESLASKDSLLRIHGIDDPKSPEGFLDFLTDLDLLDTVARSRLVRAMAASTQYVTSLILEFGLIEERQLFELLTQYLNLEFAPEEVLSTESEGDADENMDFLRKSELLLVSSTVDAISIATSTPFDPTVARAVAFAQDKKLRLMVVQPSVLRKRLDLLARTDATPAEEIHNRKLELFDGDIERLRDIASDAPIIRLLNRIIGRAVEMNASDVHIEPFHDRTRIRFRIDGVLQLAEILDRDLHIGLVSRIKVLAKLNIAEQRLPQDGRIKMAIRGKDVDFRIATSPSVDGESVVLRILDRREIPLDLESLGFSQASIMELRKLLRLPNGILLVTGPTGSGKSTTLYSALQELNRTELKIFSVEDPVERHITGISQIPIKPQIGLDFAQVLRSILRQDPDVIMIGEIRDRETAQIAVQAALTGHLVLSTLHTNSAVAAVTRLRNLGIDDFLLASSLRGILAQRLLRKCCPAHSLPNANLPCKTCSGTGYRGRTVAHELVVVSRNISEAILNGASDQLISELALREGTTSLYQTGERLVKEGITTRGEMMRVLGGPCT